MRWLVLGAVFGITWSAPTTTIAAELEDVAADARLVRVDGAFKSVIDGIGLRTAVEIDYGTFLWIAASGEEIAKLSAAGIAFEEYRDGYALTLGERYFDPLSSVPESPEGLASVRDAGPDLRLIQFVGPTKPEWLDALEVGGVKVVQYIHPFTYIVWADAANLDAAKPEMTRWTGDFRPEYRVLPRTRAIADDVLDVRVLMVRASDINAAVNAMASLGGRIEDRHAVNDTFEIVGLRVPGAQLAALARIPGVYSVQDVPTDGGLRGEMSNQVNVNNVDGTNLAFPGYLSWLAGVGLNGAGVIIANVDGGIQDSHPALAGRLIPCVGMTCGGAASSSHGTHTAGIMAADGTGGVLDVRGFLRGLGVAPGANLVEQVYSPTFTQPGGMLKLMTDSYNNGASLSGNSWGPAGTPRGYDNDTLQVDIGVRDADPNAPGNQPLTFVLSFMNGNGGTSTQGTPDEAKNIFTVGSTKMQSSGSGAQILQINDLSSNSAHGPALDGRKIPHIVAPGCYVDSTVTGSGYGLNCGTSMASPHTSGAVALFIEYYRNLPDYTVDPSPALIKAAFCVAARDLAGNRDASNGILGHPFDSKQGWGRMDVEAVVAPETSVRYFDNPMVLDNTGEEWVQTVSAMDPSRPLKIMLVWTDAPGHGLGGSTPAWNNDLDLIVEDGGSTYLGNVFDANGWSTTGGVADIRNNTEAVFIGPTAPSAYTIRVRAANLTSDGVPNSGDATDQDFSIACENCALEPGFTLNAAPAQTSVCQPADAQYSIDVGQILGFSEPVTLTATNLPAGLSADFDPNPVLPGGSSALVISGTNNVPAGDYVIEILGSATSLSRNRNISLKVFSDVPSAPSLTAPVNGAMGTAVRPVFTWAAATEAAVYAIDVATDPAFVGIVAGASGLTDTTWTPGADLAIGTLHYWRVRASNTCGDGQESGTFAFTTRVVPRILLVDDDDNGPNVRSYYTDALMALGEDYDVWDTNNTDNEPNAAQLSPYSIVIWFTGDEFGGVCGPGSAGEAALATWLNSGGKNLFICSQDYYFDRSLTSFMTSHLGVGSATSDVTQTTVTGAGSVFSGYGPYSLSYPFTNWSDRLMPNASAEVGFIGNAGNAALNKDAGTYKTVFWGFPLEAISNANDRRILLGVILDWFTPAVTLGDMNCDGTISPSDIAGFVLALTNPAEYANQFPDCDVLNADINGDGVVTPSDIADFVALLTGG